MPQVDRRFPPATRARRSDPDTSHEAAPSEERMAASQREVLWVLKIAGPSTDAELLDIHRGDWAPWEGPLFSPSRLRTARAELEELGLVRPWLGCTNRHLDSRRNIVVCRRDGSIVWEAVDG